MRHTIIGVFDTYAQAEGARSALISAGFAQTDIVRTTLSDQGAIDIDERALIPLRSRRAITPVTPPTMR